MTMRARGMARYLERAVVRVTGHVRLQVVEVLPEPYVARVAAPGLVEVPDDSDDDNDGQGARGERG